MSASGSVAWLSVAPGLAADGCLTFTWCLVERLRWDTPAVEAFHNAVTAVLTIRGAARAVAFYERAFGADGVAAVAIANGAIKVAPVADQSHGLRQGRLADPFGHHWLIGRPAAGTAGDWARTAAR